MQLALIICASSALSSLVTLLIVREPAAISAPQAAPVTHHLHASPAATPARTPTTPGTTEQRPVQGSPPLQQRLVPGARFVQLHNPDAEAAGRTDARPSVLILTPVKNAAGNLKRHLTLLQSLSYPPHKLSLGFLDSDSDDVLDSTGAPAKRPLRSDEVSATWQALQEALPDLAGRYRRVTLAQHHFGFALEHKWRHEMHQQLLRRHVMARARNQLLARALVDEEWVLWLDSDLRSFPPDLLQGLLAANRTIVVPNVVMEPGGRTYDLNSWAAPWMNPANASVFDAGAAAAQDLRRAVRLARGQPNRLDAWRGAYKPPLAPLAVDALTACPAQLLSPLLGRPGPVAKAPKEPASCANTLGVPFPFWQLSVAPGVGQEGAADPEATMPALLLEGYSVPHTVKLHKLRGRGTVELGGVGGAALLVWADLHREGLIFPPFPYRLRIETEGLAAMARDMGHRAWGLPDLEVVHA